MWEGGNIQETLHSSMSFTQIECGSSRPFFDLSADQWNSLVTLTWITHIWRECQPNGIRITFPHDAVWVPKPVREHDACIMDIASEIYSGEQLRRLNLCHISLQVTFISDILTVDGRRILLNYYNGNAHQYSGRRSRLNWPPVGDLPKSWWLLWQTFLTQWYGTNLQLQTPLGKWYGDAEMLTQCCFFLHDRRLIMQHKEGFFEFLPANARARTRFCTQAYPFEDLELLRTAKVVDIMYRHKCIYVIAQSAQNVLQTPAAFIPRTSASDRDSHIA